MLRKSSTICLRAGVSEFCRHRAADLLEWTHIDAILIEADDIQAELAMITENLNRSDLTDLQRKRQEARWIALTSEKVVSPQPVAKPTGRPESGVNAASRELGVNREDARRAVKVASLPDEVQQAAVAHGLDDNRTALLAIAKEATPEAQLAKIEEIVTKKASPKPKPMSQEDRDDQLFWELWARFGPEKRRAYAAKIQASISADEFQPAAFLTRAA